MAGENDLSQLLTPGARRIVAAALQQQADCQDADLGINHWLVALLERRPSIAEAMVNNFNSVPVKQQVLEKLAHGEIGPVLTTPVLVEKAAALAKEQNRPQVNERDLAVVILAEAGFIVHPGSEVKQLALSGEYDDLYNVLAQAQVQVTPVLDQFGTDLTRLAREGKSAPVIGRELEISLTIETLCRKTKRNPILVGPAGVGKTAIVEGLAHEVVAGNVPAVLRGCRIIALQPSILVAGAQMAGELEKRMKAVLAEARQPGIILFIDEIHTIMGAGGMLGTTDLGSMLKPALARGEIACIAATTDDEFRRYIENDTALERRFQPIRVNEMTPEETLQILKVMREDFGKENQVQVDESVLVWLVDFARQYMRNRYFPDKAVDLLEQCYAHAAARSKTGIDLQDAQEVAQRMVGMPVVTTERLKQLGQELLDRRFLSEPEVNMLLNRLQVTLRGLDMRTARPNAIMLLAGEALENSRAISECIAESLFGSVDRVISIDFSRFSSPEDLNLLVGAPPGYVGYNDQLPLHRLAQIPWCVLNFERVDTCHPRIREILAQAFDRGSLVDGRGKTLYLSDAIIIMSAEITISAQQRSMGFLTEETKLGAGDIYRAVTVRIGAALADQVDLFSFGSNDEGVSTEWLEKHFLVDLAARYLKQGAQLTWDKTFLDWVAQQQGGAFSEHDWENWVDRYLTPAIIPYLPEAGWEQPVEVVVGFEGDKIIVTRS